MTSAIFKRTRWAFVAAVALTGIAMLLYPGGTFFNPDARGYSFFHNSLSDLGSKTAWGGLDNSRAALLFISACAILTLAGLGCFIALVHAYSSTPVTRRLARAAGGAGILCCVGLLGAALTPEDTNKVLHGQFTLLASGACVVAALLFAFVTALDDRYPRQVPIGWLILTLVLVAWTLITRWRPTTDQELMFPIAFQKVVAVVVLAIFSFQSYQAERFARNKPRSQTNQGVRTN